MYEAAIPLNIKFTKDLLILLFLDLLRPLLRPALTKLLLRHQTHRLTHPTLETIIENAIGFLFAYIPKRISNGFKIVLLNGEIFHLQKYGSIIVDYIAEYQRELHPVYL